jgi:hypothetical protein
MTGRHTSRGLRDPVEDSVVRGVHNRESGRTFRLLRLLELRLLRLLELSLDT